MNKTESCQSCGEELSKNAQYRRWTQCPFCYWKQRLESSESMEVLREKRIELQHKHREGSAALFHAEEAVRDYEIKLKACFPWWKKLLGFECVDRKLAELRTSRYEQEKQLDEIERDLNDAHYAIATARHVRKRFDSQIKFRAFWRKKDLEHQKQKEGFDKRCCDSVDMLYERELFIIQKKDYKRGNTLDNHFRKEILSKILSFFDNKCLFCGNTCDLTLDHFAIPKNEGGNFILLLKDKRTIKMNVIVLCRPCNASKGELSYKEFFDKCEIDEALKYQSRLLDFVLGDSLTMKIIRSWYKIRMS